MRGRGCSSSPEVEPRWPLACDANVVALKPLAPITFNPDRAQRGWKSWHRPQNLIVSSLEETFLACSGHLVARHLDSPFQELPHVPGETQPSAITLFPWRTPIKCSRQPQHCVGSPLLPPAPTWHQRGSLGAGARGWKGYTRGPAAGAVSRCRSINRSWLPNLLATAFHSLPVFSCFFLQGGACSPRQPSALPLP